MTGKSSVFLGLYVEIYGIIFSFLSGIFFLNVSLSASRAFFIPWAISCSGYFCFKGNCFDQFRKIIVRYKRIGYNINIMRQSACLVLNPITVNNFASLFNWVGR